VKEQLMESVENGETHSDSMNGSTDSVRKRRLSSPPDTTKDDSSKQAKTFRPTNAMTEFRLSLQPAAQYTKNQVKAPFQLPVQIASFSYDESRGLHHDDRSRKYYHPPPPRADLNRGFEALVSRDESVKEHLDSLLISLMRIPEKQNIQKANLITWRGMMTKLCTVLYEDRQDWEMNAMMVGETLFLEEHVGEKQRADKARQEEDSRMKRFGYYGYSFESWTCSQERRPRDPWDGNVNTNVQWCSIIKTKLGDSRCILAGEVDAVDAHTEKPIEVKTSMSIKNDRDAERFETKMLRFYMQSFLLGISKVVVGFRDHRGYLVTHQDFETLAMPRAVRGKPHAWDPTACLNLASQLISSIRSYITEDSQSSAHLPPLDEAEKSSGYPVYRIHFDYRNQQVTASPLNYNDVLDQVKGGSDSGRVGFLLSEFYEWMK
jgi:RAT1-interacting protein